MLHIKNKKFLEVLNSWQTIDWDINLVSNQRIGPRQPAWDINKYDHISKHSTSTKYIKQILNGAEPRYYSVVQPFGEEPYGKYILDNMPFKYDFHLTAMYRPRGFVGWHNDVDIPGWYFMISYSPEGLGFFKYVDPDTKEIIKKDDVVGWNYVNFVIGTTSKKYYWHCALAPALRFSWLFGFNSEQKYNLALDILNEDIN